MNYDKNSFLAGVSVGRTLKGWATAGGTNPVVSGGDIDKLIDGTLSDVKSNAQSIRPYCFYSCNWIKTADLPEAKVIYEYAFAKSSIELVSIPNVESIGPYAFSESSIKNINIEKCNVLPVYAFKSCTSLEKVSLSICSLILGNVFNGCSSLDTLILRYINGVVSISSSTLTGTKIASGDGYVYVPAALISQYQSSSKWSSYTSQFRAIEDYPDICG